MLKSQLVQIGISRPYSETYRVVSDPKNFPRWSPLLKPLFEPRGNNGLDWLVELPTGIHLIRFSPPNDFGVLDYTVIPEDGSPGRTTRVRLVPNEDGCDLVIQFYQQPGMTNEAFASHVEWATTDFMTLKSVVETT